MKSGKRIALLGVLLIALGGVALALPPVALEAQAGPGRLTSTQQEPKHRRVDFNIPCAECHEKRTPTAVGEWQANAHGIAGVGCFVCHGDAEVEFNPRPRMETCYSCHSEKEDDAARLPAEGCFACHNGHSLKFHGQGKGQ